MKGVSISGIRAMVFDDFMDCFVDFDSVVFSIFEIQTQIKICLDDFLVSYV